MSRILSLLSVLVLAGIATLVSWLAVSSLQPKHIGMAVACWYGVVWYYRYCRASRSGDAPVRSPEGQSIVAVTPGVYVILVASFAIPFALLEWAGWLQRPNILFLYFVLSGSSAAISLAILVCVRSVRRTPPSSDGRNLQKP